MYTWLISILFTVNLVQCEYISIKWTRPRVEFDGNNYYGFANTYSNFNFLHKVVYFDICESEFLAKYPKAVVKWQFFDLESWPPASSKKAQEEREQSIKMGLEFFNTTGTCNVNWRAPRESRYTVRLLVYADNRFVAWRQTTVEVEDIWLAAIGDSWVSGEGNPDVQAAFLVLPKWLDLICARSSRSFAFETYEEIAERFPDKGILFTFLACSGASTEYGLMGYYLGKKPQLNVIEEIQEQVERSCCEGCCKTKVDALILGIGGNDLKFASVVKTFLVGLAESHFAATPNRLEALDIRLDAVAERLDEIVLSPKGVFYVEYFDPLRNDRGQLDSSCKLTGLADNEDFFKADSKIFLPLNNLMKRKSRQHGWTFVDGVNEAFQSHGLCSRDKWIRTIEESLAFQLTVNGAFHPTYEGHKATARIVRPTIERYLYSLESAVYRSWRFSDMNFQNETKSGK